MGNFCKFKYIKGIIIYWAENFTQKNLGVLVYCARILWNLQTFCKQISNLASPTAVIAIKIILVAMLLYNTTYCEGNDGTDVDYWRNKLMFFE